MLSNLKFDHEYWMFHALQLAKRAGQAGEIPVGAVLVYNDTVIGEGWNSPIALCDPTAHAEIIALRQGGLLMRNYRILNATLYVTLIPCMMCFGAILHSRISTLVYGADNTAGNKISNMLIKALKYQNANHNMRIVGGVLASTCASLLNNFFLVRRLQKKHKKRQC